MAAKVLEQDFEGVVVLHFNSRLFSGTESLVSVYFEELAAQLLERPDERSKKVGRALQTHGKIIGELRVIPVIGPLAALLGKSGEITGSRLE